MERRLILFITIALWFGLFGTPCIKLYAQVTPKTPEYYAEASKGLSEELRNLYNQLKKASIENLIEASKTDDPNIKQVTMILIGEKLADPQVKSSISKELYDKAIDVLLEGLKEGTGIVVMKGNVQVNRYIYVRTAAARALAMTGDKSPKVIDNLKRALLEDPESLVKRSVVRTLGDLKANEALDVIIYVLEGERDNALVNEIAIALGKIGDKRAFPALLKIIQGDYLDYVKVNAQKAVAEITAKEVPVLPRE